MGPAPMASEMTYCQPCEDGGYTTKATRKDADGVPFCDECWIDFIDAQPACGHDDIESDSAKQ